MLKRVYELKDGRYFSDAWKTCDIMIQIEKHIKDNFCADYIKSRYHKSEWPKVAWKTTESLFCDWQRFEDVINYAMDFDTIEKTDKWVQCQRNIAHKTAGKLMGFVR